MIRFTRLLEYTILDSLEGEILGNIADVVYSNNLQKISKIVVESGKIIKEKYLIPFNDIVSFDEDKVFVNKDNLLKMEDSSREKLFLEEDVKIIEKEVLKEDGELIGYIKDVIINPSNGKIMGFIMTQGIFEDILKGRNFIPNIENVNYSMENIVIDNKTIDQIVKNNDFYKKLLEFEYD